MLLASKIWVGESSDWWNVGKEWICSVSLGFKTFRIVRLAKHDFWGYFNWDGTDNGNSVNQNSPICKWFLLSFLLLVIIHMLVETKTSLSALFIQGEEVPFELELIDRDNFYHFLSWSNVLYTTAFISSGSCCIFCWFFFLCMTTCSTSYTYFGAVCTFLTTLKEGPDRLAVSTIIIGFLSFIIGELGI